MKIDMDYCKTCPYKDDVFLCLKCPPKKEEMQKRSVFIGTVTGKIFFQTPIILLIMTIVK